MIETWLNIHEELPMTVNMHVPAVMDPDEPKEPGESQVRATVMLMYTPSIDSNRGQIHEHGHTRDKYPARSKAVGEDSCSLTAWDSTEAPGLSRERCVYRLCAWLVVHRRYQATSISMLRKMSACMMQRGRVGSLLGAQQGGNHAHLRFLCPSNIS